MPLTFDKGPKSVNGLMHSLLICMTDALMTSQGYWGNWGKWQNVFPRSRALQGPRYVFLSHYCLEKDVGLTSVRIRCGQLRYLPGRLCLSVLKMESQLYCPCPRSCTPTNVLRGMTEKCVMLSSLLWLRGWLMRSQAADQNVVGGLSAVSRTECPQIQQSVSMSDQNL